MRFATDRTWRRFGPDGSAVLAGSPLRLFRLSASGAAVVDRLEEGEDVLAPGATDASPGLVALVGRLLDAGAVHPRPVLPGPDPAMSRPGSRVTVVTPQLDGRRASDGRIVVDDASASPIDGADLRLERNRGPAAARNAGRRLVDTEFVAFVDADVDVAHVDVASDDAQTARWWAPLIAHFDDPNVGLVAPRVVGDPSSSLDLGAEAARIRAGTRVSYVPAAMIVVRTAAFDDVGGFDETLRFGEDVDFVWRLDDAGWTCRYEPQRSVTHRRRRTRRQRWRQQVGYGTSSGPLAVRHPRRLAPFRAHVSSFGVWGLVAAGHPVVAAVLAISVASRFSRRFDDLDTFVAMRLALEGQLRTGRYLARAVRRAWWPLALVTTVVSKRARPAVLAALLASPRSLTHDVAFGSGLWTSMWRSRTLRPIVPALAARID